MKRLKHFSSLELTLLSIISVIILLGSAFLAYYLGYQHNIQTVKLMEQTQYNKDEQYRKSLETLRNENTQAATYNQTICAEYQKLYQSYENLYSTKPVDSSFESYVRPGSAKGQIDPCYETGS